MTFFDLFYSIKIRALFITITMKLLIHLLSDDRNLEVVIRLSLGDGMGPKLMKQRC